MPPTILSEETAANSPNGLSASRKWLVQAALLFGLLGLGRWSRNLPGRLLASHLPQLGAPAAALPADALPVGWRKRMPEPDQPPAETATAFWSPEP